jgi:hypothetical protein
MVKHVAKTAAQIMRRGSDNSSRGSVAACDPRRTHDFVPWDQTMAGGISDILNRVGGPPRLSLTAGGVQANALEQDGMSLVAELHRLIMCSRPVTEHSEESATRP